MFAQTNMVGGDGKNQFKEIVMKKFFAMLAVAVLACVAIFGGVNYNIFAEETAQLKDIDVYLIAGQSNGVGYTKVDSSDEQAEIAKDARYTNGFDNVLYYGYVECNKDTTLPSDIALRNVKLGTGDGGSRLFSKCVLTKFVSLRTMIILWRYAAFRGYNVRFFQNSVRQCICLPTIGGVIFAGVGLLRLEKEFQKHCHRRIVHTWHFCCQYST